MVENSDSIDPIPAPELQEDCFWFKPVLYIPQPFEFAAHSLWLNSSPEKIEHECKVRAAQLQALTLIRDRLGCCNIPISEFPWSDALYPSLVKVWGIDRFDEDAALYLDQVWLERFHPDRPQEWVVIAATTDEKLLMQLRLDDGSWIEEGTRPYLDMMLSRMGEGMDRDARRLARVLSNALKSHQLRYRHLHSVYDPQTMELSIEALYEFPIYPVGT
jgi:hypothetical protein